MTSSTFRCGSCDQQHDGPPFAYAVPAPAYWSSDLEQRPGNVLEAEQCKIGDHFFLRARLVLPVLDAEEDFEWGVWISVSAPSYDRIVEMWGNPDRAEEPPYFGWLSNELPLYEPSTLELKTKLHTQPLGIRPLVELEPTDHPLAVEQRTGVTMARVREIAEWHLHL
ncbi:DUF2199 domain-containing protein [Nocardia altamirensis]|uniref:DUF2199 domain-containing protein n=1 Tax=Nocardia altamirensis TaxID=472158 RepID=UPI00083FFE13|nr:DUF2199 domain-containing protein [Nocardia altamirensis]